MLASQLENVLSRVRKKYPQELDADATLQIERFAAFSPLEFRKHRTSGHLLKVAYSQYLIQKELTWLIQFFPEKRHIKLRIVQTSLIFPFGKKTVLAVILGIYLKEKYEILDETHILQAAQKYVPEIDIVKRSFYGYHGCDDVHFLYLELEKKQGCSFSLQEVALLKTFLPQELDRRVERRVPTLFRTPHDEEMMKSIFILSRELSSTKSTPQMMIFFDEQSATELIFSVLIVRLVHEEKREELQKVSFVKEAKCLHMHTQIVGHLRKSYLKEAVILRLQIPIIASFLRADSSINLYLAREKIASLIEQEIGRCRDYNGGLILNRLKALSQFKTHFRTQSEDFIENIFQSMIPLEMQATLTSETLEQFLSLFFNAMESKEAYSLNIEKDKQRIFVALRVPNANVQEILSKRLPQISTALICASTQFQGNFYLGFIYQESCPLKKQEFLQSIHQGIEQWREQIHQTQVLRLSVLNLPISLDPRLGGDEISGNILRMVYEGLMRMGPKGIPLEGMAKSVHLSADARQYTFFLRDAQWSNAAPVRADDFEYAWKKILSPTFKTPFDHLLFPIKNARLAKEGVLPLDSIGVKALNRHTLYVELETPLPYFLELTTHTIYSPVQPDIDKLHPDWASSDGDSYVCNGPFRLKKHILGRSCEVVKNEHYWDAAQVKLDKILIFKSTPYDALERYRKSEIDWLGRPLIPWEQFFSAVQSNECTQKILPQELSRNSSDKISANFSSIISWCVCNTQRFPLNHPKIRQALACCIDRKSLVETLAYDGLPAFTPLPLIQTFHLEQKFPDGDLLYAQKLFNEALQELGITAKELPPLTLIHINREIKKYLAELIQQQWEKTLGVRSHLESYEWKTLFAKTVSGDYHCSLLNWVATIDHPRPILEVFGHPLRINFTRWNHPLYQALLEGSLTDLAQAEQILMQELPVIPLFYEAWRFEKKPYLKDVHISKFGSLDFKSAYIFKPRRPL